MGTPAGAWALRENVNTKSTEQRSGFNWGLQENQPTKKRAGLKPGRYGREILAHLEALEDSGGAHAPAYAHGDHAESCVAALEFAD